ncbi:AI-2E family transporter [Dactylosporangium sp. AC04546]|uniref:AI-2E family transporter n=1 Tax=Dactylosporangium sp. AC04546 TaxID=2862460 RepID=UPI001EDD4348|nr:AI-2E family transporter [Dactylosporangium sp. AC04546]WVK81259.1 AI-2E family transporter [Dactylosporangium sp. AC04546]
MRPRWFVRLGRTGWLVAGAIGGAALLAAAVGVLVPLVMPLLLMVVIASTVQPLVARLRRLGLATGPASLLGALVVPLALAIVGGLLVWVLVRQAADWKPALAEAGRRLHEAIGADPVQTVLKSATWRTALLGVGAAVANGAVLIGQVAIGVLAGVYLLYYLLRDGHRVVAAVERRVPGPSHEYVEQAATQLRRYMLGTTVVALMDAAVITLGAAVLRVPFLLTIAVVTFVTAFVPYLGAWVAAIFAVLLALGAGGVTAAVWMVVIVLITQNVLEGILRPFVFGRALNLHPVVVLAATVLGAALGGLCGVFLAPPLAAIARTWWNARRQLTAAPAPTPAPAPAPSPAPSPAPEA